MKKVLFLHGPAGVGKSTVCAALHARLPGSAWVESECCRRINPFLFTEETIALTERNMAFLIRGYLECSLVSTVILTWGLHGPRAAILARVRASLADLPFQWLPIALTCSEEDHVRRMVADGREEERIQRSLATRALYAECSGLVLDTSGASVAEVVEWMVERVTSDQ